jgi:hypothetical protein
MAATLIAPRTLSRPTLSRDAAGPERRRSRRPGTPNSDGPERPLARYTDGRGRVREVLACSAAHGTVLVVDREASTLLDCRLVAHLGSDEPATNADLVCSLYLREALEGGSRCRSLAAADRLIAPFAAVSPPRLDPDRGGSEVCRGYRIRPVVDASQRPQLRWCRPSGERASAEDGPLSLRDVVAAMQSYEPMCAITASAIREHTGPDSTAMLRSELARVQESPIVLNRLLREVVCATVATGQLSMSEIALRCGRVKRDRNGNESGETSWLGRRIGLLPESGRNEPTPWVHTEVLAQIARRGLGVSPREVEL